jgi:hypothetical protein
MGVAERKLTLIKGDSPDWYLIEWAEHAQQHWLERTGPNVLALRWTGRISDADVEGTAAEMLAIAEAIERGESVYFKRCAVSVDGNRYTLSSPRNSQDPGIISRAQASQLVAEIRRVLASVPNGEATCAQSSKG